MKLRCQKTALITAFQVVGGVVPSRTPKEILQNVKLEVAQDRVILSGTDLEIGIRYEIPNVEVAETGETLLPAKRVSSILGELTAETVDFEMIDEKIWIRSGTSEFQLSVEDAAEFPPVVDFMETSYHAISGQLFREAVKRTIFATDTESTRYALGGVLMELEAETFTLAATDSRRLSVVKSACRTEGDVAALESLPVIPAKAMTLIERSIEKLDEEVLIAFESNSILVKSGQSIISSRLVEGRFPKYRDVIPNESKVVVDFISRTFLSAVRQAQIVTSEESRGVNFTLVDGTLKLSSKAADIGESTIELPVDYSGEELTVTFDPRFVADFLRVLEPETTVHLHLIDAESAAVLRTDDSYEYVIMPLSND